MGKILACAALLALVACTTAKGSFCAVEHPIRLSKATVAALTDAEVKDILEHNERGQRLCGWKP